MRMHGKCVAQLLEIYVFACNVCMQGKYTERPLETNLEKVLSPKEMEVVMTSQHKVVKSISMLGEIANQVCAWAWKGPAAHAARW